MKTAPYKMAPQARTGWSTLSAAVPTAAMLLCQPIAPASMGVGEPAHYLITQNEEISDVYDADTEAKALGWSVPPAARIPVALEGLSDIDWHLEPHEIGF